MNNGHPIGCQCMYCNLGFHPLGCTCLTCQPPLKQCCSCYTLISMTDIFASLHGNKCLCGNCHKRKNNSYQQQKDHAFLLKEFQRKQDDKLRLREPKISRLDLVTVSPLKKY